MKRHHVILAILALAWLGYMVALVPDAIDATQTVIMED